MSTPSVHRKKQEPWDEILLRVIQVQGPDILSRLVQEKIRGASVPQATFAPAELGAQLAVLRERWNSLSVYDLRGQLEQAAFDFAKQLGFASGALTGALLPQIDLKLAARDKDKDALVLHAAALMLTEIAGEWLIEVLRRTLLAPALSDREARILRGIEHILQSLLKGVSWGWSARQAAGLWLRLRRTGQVKQHWIATDARGVRLAQELIERLRR